MEQQQEDDTNQQPNNKLIPSKLESDAAFHEWLNSSEGKEMYLKLAEEYPDGIDQLLQLRVHEDPVKLAEHPVPIPGDPYGDFRTDLYDIVNATKEKYLPYDAKIPKNEIFRDVLESSTIEDNEQQHIPQLQDEASHVSRQSESGKQQQPSQPNVSEGCDTDKTPPTPPLPTGDEYTDNMQKLQYENRILTYQLSQFKCLNQKQEQELQDLRNRLQVGQEALIKLKDNMTNAVKEESFETQNELQELKEKHAEKEANFLYETARMEDELNEKQTSINEIQEKLLKTKKEKNEALLNSQRQADIVKVMERNANNDIKQLEETVQNLNQNVRRLEQQKTQLVEQLAMCSGGGAGSSNHFHGNYEQMIQMKMALQQKDQQIGELMDEKIELNRKVNRYETKAQANARFAPSVSVERTSKQIINDYQKEVEKLRQENLRLVNRCQQKTSGFKTFIEGMGSIVGTDAAKQQQLHDTTLNMTNVQKIREDSSNEILRLNQIIKTLIAVNEELKDSCLTCLQTISSLDKDDDATMEALKRKLIQMTRQINHNL